MNRVHDRLKGCWRFRDWFWLFSVCVCVCDCVYDSMFSIVAVFSVCPMSLHHHHHNHHRRHLFLVSNDNCCYHQSILKYILPNQIINALFFNFFCIVAAVVNVYLFIFSCCYPNTN